MPVRYAGQRLRALRHQQFGQTVTVCTEAVMHLSGTFQGGFFLTCLRNQCSFKGPQIICLLTSSTEKGGI